VEYKYVLLDHSGNHAIAWQVCPGAAGRKAHSSCSWGLAVSFVFSPFFASVRHFALHGGAACDPPGAAGASTPTMQCSMWHVGSHSMRWQRTQPLAPSFSTLPLPLPPLVATLCVQEGNNSVLAIRGSDELVEVFDNW